MLLHFRWEKFSKNVRARFSFWAFLGLLVITSPAELVCNQNPLLLYYQDHLYCPLLFFYPETTFGGDLPTEADYQDVQVKQWIYDKGGWMLWPFIPYGEGTVNINLSTSAPSPPSWDNWLGTDDQGRDVLVRLIYGVRTSIFFGVILTLCSSVIGIIAGAVQGYFGGIVDLLFQRFIEIWSGLPLLFLLILIGSVIQTNFWVLLGIMLLFRWTNLTSVVRAEFLRARHYDYVRAAQILGVGSFRIMVRHILPNAMVATITRIPFSLSYSITILTSLDFLGFGMPLGTPSLGELLQQGKNNLHAPWLGGTAFISIAFLLIILIFMGEGVRDALDPRKEI